MSTIFDKIVSGDIPAYKVWETEDHLAFLTPFANTPGVTVVIPKVNLGDDVFELDDESYLALQSAVKQVADLLKRALGVSRVALVFEGTGVAHVHAKLYPLYGELADQTDVWHPETVFSEEYKGYITTQEGPEMDADRLEAIQAKIVEADV